ncbi:uncharacterized protein [Amphiura filiformis]|uniref:uncharacterized protein n=1 Tax=Amphiura filiformis TaxID=82378 RepID=UPI003B21917C
MRRLLLVALVAVFMAQYSTAVQYVFHAPSYTMVEVPGQDTTYTGTSTVMISRTDESPNEQNEEREITLSTDCPYTHPNSVIATASGNDYTIPLSVKFNPGELEREVPVTIENDNEEESDEFFCLTITENPGSQNTTKIIIPANDFCYEISTDGENNDYGIDSGVYYVGPWLPSLSNMVEFTINPVTGTDISIFLSTVANLNDANLHYYQIILDDTDAITHGSTANGDTTLFRDGIPGGGTFLDEFVSIDGEGLLKNDGSVDYSFWLKYEQSSGTISIGDPSDRNTAIAQYSDGSGNALAVKHIYVKSSTADSASFKVCLPVSPKKISPSDENSVGYQNGGRTFNAVDGNRNPSFESNSCFLSSTVDDPWIQIDLGQVYDVRCVLIWPAADNADLGVDDADIHGAQVRVGSCPSDNIASNNLCYTADTGAGNNANPIEGDCPASTYGRYVYIYQPTTGTTATQFALCEVEVYGTAVPYGSETTVQFTKGEYEVNENAGTVELSTYRTFPSNTATCTWAEYYTDNGVTPSSGNSNDFVAILNDPLTASTRRVFWDEGDVSGDADSVLQKFTITINNDNPGRCEAYETFFVYLTNIVGGIAGEQYWTAVKIIDEDSVSFSFAQDTFTVIEGDGSAGIEILRSGVGTMQRGTAELTFTDNTATSADYDNSPKTVNFDASNNAEAETGAVEIEDDQRYEETESFTVNLGELSPNDGCSTYGQYSSATVFISDDDSRFRFLVENGASISIPEGESRNIQISREGTDQDKTLEIVVNDGTADLGDDFDISPSPSGGVSSVTFVANDEDTTITITAENDSDIEGPETFTLTLRDPLYPDGNRADPFSLTITITDKNAEYFWKQTSYSVRESSGSFSVCLIRATGETEARTVFITSASVTATPNVDFSPLTRIEFLQGQTEKCETVQILADTALESNEVFTLTISNGQNIITSQNTATVTIIDDDNFVGWSLAAYTFAEDSINNNNVVISKSGPGSVSVTITISSGTATQYEDFNLNIGSSSTITIPTGAQSYTLPLTITNDNEDESNEIFTLTLSSATNGIITQAQTTITITDDDMAAPAAPGRGLGGGVIAGIIVAAVVGLILIIIIVLGFCYMTGGFTRARPVAVAGLPLANYPPGYAVNNGIGYNGPNVYGLKGLPNAGYVGNNPYLYGPYR